MGGGLHHSQQVALQKRQHHLGLRVSETAVVLNDLRAVGRKHQPEIQTAFEGPALRVHGRNGGFENRLHAHLCDLRRIIGVGRDGAHAAGVQAPVAVQRALVVHAGHHGHDGFSVGKAEYRNLRPREKLLDDDTAARRAELPVLHDAFHSGQRRGLVLADQHALAQRKAVRLDDKRVLPVGAHISRGLARVRKRLVGGRGDAVLLHQVFAEHLAAFQNGGGLVGAKGGNALFRQRVHHAQHQRVVRRDDHIIDALLHSKGHHARHVGGGDGHAHGVAGDTAVARRGIQRGAPRAFLQLADDSVLPPAPADNQNLHRSTSLLSPPRRQTRAEPCSAPARPRGVLFNGGTGGCR